MSDSSNTPPTAEPPHLHVVAAIIRGTDQKILLTYRNAKQHQGEKWEFPGGKVEADETREQALTRELEEELGITPQQFVPFLSLTHDYPEKRISLHFFEVFSFTGEPQAKEQQPMRWWRVEQLTELTFPDANVPVVAALQLPEQWFILPESNQPQTDLAQAFANNSAIGGVYLRGITDKTLLTELVQQCRTAQKKVMISAKASDQPFTLAKALGASGVHFPEPLAKQPINKQGLLASMACHNANSLQTAQQLAMDFAFLSPVLATKTHPDALPIGWQVFQQWVADVSFPVYALGGQSDATLTVARQHGARGIAGIRGVALLNQ